uniref:SFRICE_009063 n=1 Tax=Spodoptera frugiperda TaxID=7108 RepID=A0A2H1WZS9_SPOFR
MGQTDEHSTVPVVNLKSSIYLQQFYVPCSRELPAQLFRTQHLHH